MRVSGWIQNNFRGLSGGNFDVLPSLKIFFPGIYERLDWTVHFAFLFWTVGIHFYPKHTGFFYRTVKRWTTPHKYNNKRKQFSVGNNW